MDSIRVRHYPDRDNYRLVSGISNGREFAYYNDGVRESFEVYFLRDGDPAKGHYYSRVYKLSEGQVVPKRYADEFTRLRHEFDRVFQVNKV